MPDWIDKKLFLKNVKTKIERDDKDFGKQWIIRELLGITDMVEAQNDGHSKVKLNDKNIHRLKQLVWWFEDNKR